MLRTCLAVATLAVPLHTAATGQVISGPKINPETGHAYYLLGQSGWAAAQELAASLGGDLATIEDDAENAWIFDTFGRAGGVDRNLWIGLNDIETEGEFRWASGKPVVYTRWATTPPQPDDVYGGQDAVRIIAENDEYFGPFDGASRWDDVNETWIAVGGNPTHGVAEVEPRPCPADFDRDAAVTVADLLGFLRAFRLHAADHDFDGDVDVSDLLGYLADFRDGCVR